MPGESTHVAGTGRQTVCTLFKHIPSLHGWEVQISTPLLLPTACAQPRRARALQAPGGQRRRTAPQSQPRAVSTERPEP